MTSPPTDARDAALDDQALEWFARSRAGLDAAGHARLQAWLAASQAHAAALQRWQAHWDALDALPPAGIALLRSQLARDLAVERERTKARRRSWFQPALAAAGLVAVIGGAWLAVDGWRQRQPLFAQSFKTQRGERMAVTLPDGSHVQLDTATRSEVALFHDRRELRLPQGQAVLQVARGAARPFEVLAGPLRITVLGTRFAVRYTPEDARDGQARVAVEEGLVRVAPAGGTTAVELHAGEQVQSDAAGRLGTVSRVPAAGIAPWRDGRLSFEDATLAQVLAELERYAPTGLTLPDARVGELRLTGTFDPHRLENFRRVLPQVLPVRLQPRGERTEIVGAR